MFINKNKKQMRVLWYDGQGFLLCTKRSSQGSFSNWPKSGDDSCSIFSFIEAQIIFSGGDHASAKSKEIWKKIA